MRIQLKGAYWSRPVETSFGYNKLVLSQKGVSIRAKTSADSVCQEIISGNEWPHAVEPIEICDTLLPTLIIPKHYNGESVLVPSEGQELCLSYGDTDIRMYVEIWLYGESIHLCVLPENLNVFLGWVKALGIKVVRKPVKKLNSNEEINIYMLQFTSTITYIYVEEVPIL